MQVITWTATNPATNEYWIALKSETWYGGGRFGLIWKWDEIDGADLKNNKKWKWWRQGEPNNAGGKENCAVVRSGGTAVWDISCNEEKPVLCVRCKLHCCSGAWTTESLKYLL